MLFEITFRDSSKSLTSAIVDGKNKTEAKNEWRRAFPDCVFISIARYI